VLDTYKGLAKLPFIDAKGNNKLATRVSLSVQAPITN